MMSCSLLLRRGLALSAALLTTGLTQGTAAAVSIPLGMGVTLLIRHAGGFTVAPVDTTAATAAELPHHLWLAVQSVLMLFGASFIGVTSAAGAVPSTTSGPATCWGVTAPSA